jgi:hypothetical protein
VWWKFSRCENSARATAGGMGARRSSTLLKALRRCTRRWFSQRENRHQQEVLQTRVVSDTHENSGRCFGLVLPSKVGECGGNFSEGTGMKTLKRWQILWSLIAALWLPAVAQGQFTFTTNNGAITITGYNGNPTALAIPSTINFLPVTTIGNFAFSNNASLTSVIIPNGVTNISQYAFAYCTNLISITNSASIIYIGARAFAYCPNLTGVFFQGNAPASGSIVLFQSSNATVYVLPGTTGWNQAFGGRVTALWLPFDYYNYTTNNGTITISIYMSPNGSVTIPSTINNLPVTGIGAFAFTNCSGLTNITIPNSITNIGFCAFANGSNLTSINVDVQNVFYTNTADGVLFNRTKTALLVCPAGKVGTFTMPASVTEIGTGAFYYCRKLTSVTIPGSVFNIGDWAFYSASNLTNVLIGTNVTRIGLRSFQFCSSLTSVMVGSSVTNLLDYSFAGCSNLASAVIQNGVASIGQSAFSDCSSLTNIVIPDSVINLGNGCFYNCSSLTRVVIGNNVNSINPDEFGYCGSMTNVTIGINATNIASGAFYHCTNLASIAVPNLVLGIGDNAFDTCSSLTNITMSSGVTRLGDHTFLGCQFSHFIIPNTVSSLGDYVFASCDKLTDIIIPAALTNISAGAFYFCTNLVSISLPTNIASLGNGAFQGCGFNTFIFPNTISQIGNYMFAACASLTNVIIPNNVTSIGDAAFAWSGLTSITIPSGVNYLGGSAFQYCYKLKSIFYQGYPPALWTFFGQSGLQFGGDTNATAYYLPATLGWWDSTFAGLPTVLWITPQPQMDDGNFGVRTNRFGFNLTGTSNLVVVVEAATNLINSVWSPVSTNTLTNGLSYFSDANWTNSKYRFYRIRSP